MISKRKVIGGLFSLLFFEVSFGMNSDYSREPWSMTCGSDSSKFSGNFKLVERSVKIDDGRFFAQSLAQTKLVTIGECEMIVLDDFSKFVEIYKNIPKPILISN